MMADNIRRNVLQRDLMELQLGQIDLLMAMYESDNAISIDNSSRSLLQLLRDWCETDQEEMPEFTQSSITMLLSLDISDTGDSPSQETKSLQLNLSVPLVFQEGGSGVAPGTEPPPVKTRVQQPTWMSKGEVAQLTADIPDEDILSVIEHVKEAAIRHLEGLKQVTEGLQTDTSIVRVWFYFPSISTRAKRDDIVHYAPTYGLTGFLLAGKPGVLCLEGGSVEIDNFMKFIKTESWGDIPSQHKKVTERFREEEAELKRAFKDMREVTDMIGERRGERANRNDMKALEAWLIECGLGEAFGKVIM